MLRHILTTTELVELGLDDHGMDSPTLVAERRLHFSQFFEIRQFLLLLYACSWVTCAGAIWTYWHWSARQVVKRTEVPTIDEAGWELVSPPAMMFYWFVAVSVATAWAEVIVTRNLLDAVDQWANWDIVGLGLGLLGRATVFFDALFLVLAYRLGHPIVALAGFIVSSLGYLWLIMGHQTRMLLALFSLKDDYSADNPSRFFNISVVTDMWPQLPQRSNTAPNPSARVPRDYWQLLFEDEADTRQTSRACEAALNPCSSNDGSDAISSPIVTPIPLLICAACRRVGNTWVELLGSAAPRADPAEPATPELCAADRNTAAIRPQRLKLASLISWRSGTGSGGAARHHAAHVTSPGLSELSSAIHPSVSHERRSVMRPVSARSHRSNQGTIEVATTTAGSSRQRDGSKKPSSATTAARNPRMSPRCRHTSSSSASANHSSHPGPHDLQEFIRPPPRGHGYIYGPGYAFSLTMFWGLNALARCWACWGFPVVRRLCCSVRRRATAASGLSATAEGSLAAKRTAVTSPNTEVRNENHSAELTQVTTTDDTAARATTDDTAARASPGTRHMSMLQFVKPFISLGLGERATAHVAARKVEPAMAPRTSLDKGARKCCTHEEAQLAEGRHPKRQLQQMAFKSQEGADEESVTAGLGGNDGSWSSSGISGVGIPENEMGKCDPPSTTTADNPSCSFGSVQKVENNPFPVDECQGVCATSSLYSTSSHEYRNIDCIHSSLLESRDYEKHVRSSPLEVATRTNFTASSGEVADPLPGGSILLPPPQSPPTGTDSLRVVNAWLEDFDRVQRRVIVNDSKIQQLTNLSYSLNAEMLQSVLCRAFVSPDLVESNEFSAAISATMRCFLEDLLLGVLKVYILISSRWPPFVLASLILSIVQAFGACLRNTVDTDLWADLLAAD